LRNLLENALKYTVTNPQITVQLYPPQTDEAGKQILKIAVHDNGIGLAQSERAKLFERFYRVNSSITQQVQGSGLGLAICRGIIEAHGGSIWAESPGLEQGSSFFFTLPVADMSYVAELE
jgi:signal transduction histidine kinase